MLALKPLKSPHSVCPACGKSNNSFDSCDLFGIHILGSGNCAHCGVRYYHNWPLGHGSHFPIAFTDNGKARYSEKASQWMAKPLIKAVKQRLGFYAEIHRVIRHPAKNGLLLNCLDSCYGHIIWKLFNAAYYHKKWPQKELVVLIPKQCAWMVPDYVAEIWQVDAPIHKFDTRVEGLNEFVESLDLNALELAPLGTHLDHKHLPVEDFFKTKSFDIATFSQRPLQVTFIWRSDRFWLRSRGERILWMVGTKYNVPLILKWLGNRQRLAMQKVAKLVRNAIPEASFRVTGLGKPGTFIGVEDLRKTKLTVQDELEWCRIYSESHLVLGVHGSSMLVPTALAAGFIELMPSYKIPLMTEDILMRHSPRYQLYLGRHLDLLSAPHLVARHIVDLYQSFPYLQSNTDQVL